MGQTRKVSDAEVRKVHKSALLIDGHNDVTSATVDGLDLGPRRNEGHTDIARMKEGGMTAQFFAAYVGVDSIERKEAAHRALQMIDTIRHDIVARHPGDFTLGLRSEDIPKARKSGKMAALIGVEGGHAIEDDVRLLRTYYDLGARYMTLTHSKNLKWAGSSGEKDNQGLTETGKQLIAEMNRLGMMVDIAHVSDQTFRDVVETSKAPVFSSHSSCRSLSNIPRNMTDDMIRAVAKKGGLVMINLGCEFLSQKSADSSPWSNPELTKRVEAGLAGLQDAQQRRAAIKKLMAEMELKTVRATLADVVAHIDHVRQIAGVDAVGLGSDFDGVSCVPEGLEDVSKWPNLTRALLEKGYSAGEIRKIYGGNLLRFMKAVEQVAAK
jgi:membrane dipeptidase